MANKTSAVGVQTPPLFATGYVYCIINRVNGKRYVGQTRGSPSQRKRVNNPEWCTNNLASLERARAGITSESHRKRVANPSYKAALQKGLASRSDNTVWRSKNADALAKGREVQQKIVQDRYAGPPEDEKNRRL